MTRAEIRQKFDAIVAFAEVEKFLDTPVKRYSSGMYVRLAFAVAAHLDPDILVIDEVLAVGDTQFQERCLGRMRDVAQDGRTVLFVSHNLDALRALCHRGIRLGDGRLQESGSAADVVEHYITESRTARIARQPGAFTNLGASVALTRFSIMPTTVEQSQPIDWHIELVARSNTSITGLAILVHSMTGVRIGVADLRDTSGRYHLKRCERLILRGTLECLGLVEGEYWFGIYLETSELSCDACELERVRVKGENASGPLVPYSAKHRGFVTLRSRFKHALERGT